MILPNLIIGGAPKSGTSSLHFWLEAHPETHGSKRKDSCFLGDEILRFNEDLSYINDGLEGYQQLFSKSQAEKSKVVFESTATYIYYENTPKVIGAMETKPKVAFILRNPVSRLVSQYLFEKHRTQRVKGLSLPEYLDNEELLKHGDYVNYLKMWESIIGRERMIIFIFEDFMADPISGMKEFAKALNIDPSFYDNFDFAVRNETVRIKSSKLHQWGLKLQPLVPSKIQSWILPFYLKMNSAGKPSLNKEEQALIDKTIRLRYAKAQEQLEEFLGRKIECWD